MVHSSIAIIANVAVLFTGLSAAANQHRCFLPLDVGRMQIAQSPLTRYYYNSDLGQCLHFSYYGNQPINPGNNFRLLADCVQLCQVEPMDPCEDYSCPRCKTCRVNSSNQPVCVRVHAVMECCSGGSRPVHCKGDPCQVTSCDVEGAHCIANYCGGCKAEFYDRDWRRRVCRRQ